MDFSNNENIDSIKEGIKRITDKFPDEYWAKCDAEETYPQEFFNAIAAAGWVGTAYPKEYGGDGLGVIETACILEEVAASGGALNACSAFHVAMFGLQPVVKYGNEEQKQRWLPAAARGELHFSFGVTEPTAGTDTTRITTFATRVDGGYLINGQKIWNSGALQADKILLITRTTKREESTSKTLGMTLFLAHIDPEHVQRRAIPKMGRNAVASCEVFFDDLFVPEADRIGEEGKGFYYLLDGLNAERILVAAEAIGIGKAALRRAVEYARDRIVFDRPIGMNQSIQSPLAHAHMQLEAAELMMLKAAWLCDQNLPCGPEATMSNYLAAEASFYAADRAVQTLGGMGYAKEFHVERYFREARIMRLGPLSQEMIQNYIGEHVLGLPRSY
jgi:acyl-CoA dehydrogenase